MPELAEVRRAEHARVGLEQRHEVAVAPDVVPGRDHVGACVEDRSASLAVSPMPSAAFSPFTTQKSIVELVPELGQPVRHGPPAGRAEDVTDEEELQ